MAFFSSRLHYGMPLLAGTMLALAGCNGSGTTASPLGAPTASPTASPIPGPVSETASLTVGAAPVTATFAPLANGLAASLTLPAATSGSATAQVTYALAPPAGTPALSALHRRPAAIGASALSGVAYVTLATSATVTLSGTPSLTFTPTSAFTSLPNSTPAYLALYDPSRASSGWTVFAGPIPLSNTQAAAFASTAVQTTLQAGTGRVIALFVSSSAIPTPTSTNPIDDPTFFVTQQYRDFLNREPDQAGLNFWLNEINSCKGDAQCVDIKRQNVSAAYFLSIEFHDTGFLVYQLYKASFGNLAGQSVPVRFSDFISDVQTIGTGVIVGQTGYEQRLEANKVSFTTAFVNRDAFKTQYDGLAPPQFVDQLNANTGNSLTQTDRDALVNSLLNGKRTRAQVLRQIADPDINQTFKASEFNRAFVLMEYFGYLRRNPTDPPDNSDAGYQAYLNKLNQFNGDYIKSEMVRSFITSTEYRSRFGPP